MGLDAIGGSGHSGPNVALPSSGRTPQSRGTFELSPRRMSVQILLQGKLLGVEEFLPSGQPAESLLTGRLRWVSLLSEVLPRALIAELGLSKMLLGSSGGEQFLVVLPEEVRPQVEEFLVAARQGIRELSQNRLELFWAITENLGDWTVVRKRLNEEFQRKQGTPLAATGFGGTWTLCLNPNPIRPISRISALRCAMLRASVGRPNRRQGS